MKVILDGRQMNDRAALHEYLKEKLEFPEYYGKNLDALFDLLTEMGNELTIVIENADILKESLGDYGQSLIETFEDAARENSALAVVIK